jgi:hypothetical protein
VPGAGADRIRTGLTPKSREHRDSAPAATTPMMAPTTTGRIVRRKIIVNKSLA